MTDLPLAKAKPISDSGSASVIKHLGGGRGKKGATASREERSEIMWEKQVCEGPTLKQFLKNCSSWEETTLEKFVENCLPWDGPHNKAREECKEEGAAETTCNELTATSVPQPPVVLERRR